ncbi:MAG TPA: amino acid adenylation domain-containing protein [Candidatus Binatia bacterium]|nr:amino acid adenylation domain-containing protein [Candidatus Binatia bacterium]
MTPGEREVFRRIAPVSHGQERLWLLDRLEPGTPAYTIARALRMRGALSVPALRDSLREVVARHESLRTTFEEVDGRPIQVITAGDALELPIVDLSALPEAAREIETQRLIRDEARRPFELSRGPLLRAILLRLQAQQHVLLLLMHHIVTDAWSMSVLFKEITRAYEAAATGRAWPPDDLPMQYADFARRQRATLTPEMLERHLAYWRTQLAGADPAFDLPADRARPVVRTAHGAVQTRVLPPALADRLTAVSRGGGATLFMTLLAAFQTLLSRYTGRDDIVVGVATAGRSELDLERLIGFFVNTVVLRTDLSGDPTFPELLARVRENALEAYSHGEIPFEKIVEALKVPRSLSHSPLFQVMFILQNAPKQTFDLPGLRLDELDIDIGTAKFDLTVEMAETDDGLFCGFEYSTDVFEHATVSRMIGHFQTLLEGIAADPGRRLSALPLMGDAERRRLLVEWNDTSADYPRDRCIHQLFEAQATRTPGAVALLYRDQQITYAELNTRANRLAARLSARGVGRGVPVGVCIERSIDAVVGLLGVLKAGGAYIPMDPTYPPARLAFMLQDSRAPVLLTVQRLLERVPSGASEVVCLDAIGEADTGAAGYPDGDVSPQDPAYVIYTSGSTGTPKGVLSPHRASINRFAWMWRRWPFGPDDVCCQTTALSFVDVMWEVFGPLLQGARTVIVPDEAMEDPARLVEILSTSRVTRIVLVPSFLRLLLDSVPDISDRLSRLRFWVTSGEAITPELAGRFADALPGATLVNLYGSSEVAADATAYVVENTRSLERIPIGRPIANTRVYVLDRHSNLVPIGVPGEIHVGGDGLACGYLGNPELTAQKFIPDPFGRAPDDRLYMTGDRGRILPDGNLEFLGRVDNQVKIRGIRIEPSEIEAVLRAHPAIEAAVVTVAGAGGDERLIGHVVLRGGGPVPGDLRDFLRQRLPDYMLPAAFVTIDALPLTPNGKVDRHALRSPEPAREREPTLPRTREEEALAKIFAEVLKLDRVGVHDNFFELGGHSLLGIQVIARVRKVFRVELPLRRLFEEPTIAGLVREIARAERSGDAAAAPAPTRSGASRDRLMAHLAGLSDAEVEALLKSMPAGKPDERVIEEF